MTSRLFLIAALLLASAAPALAAPVETSARSIVRPCKKPIVCIPPLTPPIDRR